MRAAILIISGLLLVVLAAFLAPIFKADPGYVLVRFQGWSLETSVLVLILSLLLIFILIRLAFWLWRWPLRTAEKVRENVARNRLEKGLLALVEGDFKTAEKALSKSSSGDQSTVALLGAARAAEGLSNTEGREEYLTKVEGSGKKNMLVALSRAEMLMANEQWQEATFILEDLQKTHPKHQQTRTFLYHCYRNTNNWIKAGDMAPGLRKQGVIDAEEEADGLHRMYQQKLTQAADLKAVHSAWKGLPRAVQKESALIGTYADLLVKYSANDEAETLIRKSLNREWSPELIHQYALLDGGDPLARLKQTEKWLQKQPEDPGLHLAVGRLCLANKIWGKAREHLEASLRYHPDEDAYATLGGLCHRLGDLEQASDYYRQALELCRR